MKYIIIFADDVFLELRSQSKLLEKARKGYATLLVLDFEETIEHLRDLAKAYRKRHFEWRIIQLKRFQFVIVYHVFSDKVFVARFVHARAHPEKMFEFDVVDEDET